MIAVNQDDSEVLEDKYDGKENVECEACPTKTRDAKNTYVAPREISS